MKQLIWISATFNSGRSIGQSSISKEKLDTPVRFQCQHGVKEVVDYWIQAANISSGKLFRRVHKMGKAWGNGLTEKAVWHVVREYAAKAGIEKLAPHDLRRTCARLCHAAGGELEQIQFLLGHVSVQTTERYLGWKQRIRGAVNDKIGIESPE